MYRRPIVRGLGDLRPQLAGRLLLTYPIVTEERALRFAHDVLFADERDVIATGNGKEEAETQFTVTTTGVAQYPLDERTEISRVGAMNHPRQLRRSARPIIHGAKPLGDATSINRESAALPRNGDAYLAGVQPCHHLIELGGEVRAGGVASRLSCALFERLIERSLRRFRHRERCDDIDRYDAAEIGGANTLRIGAHEDLGRTRSI